MFPGAAFITYSESSSGGGCVLHGDIHSYDKVVLISGPLGPIVQQMKRSNQGTA